MLSWNEQHSPNQNVSNDVDGVGAGESLQAHNHLVSQDDGGR